MADAVSFKAVLANYYKGKSAKAEECLGDIIRILERDVPEGVHVSAILERLEKHYSSE